MKIPQLKCKRCNHKWIPRQKNRSTCPKCKSPYWNKPRIKKERVEKKTDVFTLVKAVNKYAAEVKITLQLINDYKKGKIKDKEMTKQLKKRNKIDEKASKDFKRIAKADGLKLE